MDIVIATRNKKKVEEIGRIFAGLGIVMKGLDEFPEMPDVIEDGLTFEANAIKKAEAVTAHTGLPSLADDSGIEADAIGKAPGVLSARYAGEGATDADNLKKLLEEMNEMPDELRQGRFVCVMAFARPRMTTLIFRGTVEGVIGRKPKGSNGFGYDPVFFPEGHSRTFAEMTGQEKDSMSHRGRALQKVLEYMSSIGLHEPKA